YALHEIAIAKDKVAKKWIFLAGIAVGVGTQLHTLALVFFPVVAAGTLGFLLYKKKKVWMSFFAIIFIALFLNIPQIVSEVRSGGENTKAFFGGVGVKEKKGNGILVDIAKNTVCFSQANAYVLSSYDSSDTCELKSVTK